MWKSRRRASACGRPSRTPASSSPTTSTVNLAPADLPKDSGRFDLPIALGILAASGQIEAARLAGHEFAGELSLSGQLRPVRGALAMALALHTGGVATRLVLPATSAQEASLVPGAEVYGAQHLLDVVQQFLPEGSEPPSGAQGWSRVVPSAPAMSGVHPDLADVKGHAGAKRALEIAAAGNHSLLMVGPPGSGKSMLAQRFAGLLPAMSVEEALETAAVASLSGRFDTARWMRRPTSSPHHTASAVALVGGGSPPRPARLLSSSKVVALSNLRKSTAYARRFQSCTGWVFKVTPGASATSTKGRFQAPLPRLL